MKKILLIVSNHEDAKLLPKAAQSVSRLGCGMLWVWHSPILGIDPEKECKVIDDEIKALVAGEKDAASRGDYETAKSRKAEREKLQLNRSVEIRNAWKRVSPEGRKEAIGRFMEPMLDVLNPKREKTGIGVRISAFPEHQDAAFWVAALNEVKMVLEKDGFVGGSFAMMWPAQLAGVEKVDFQLPAPEYTPRLLRKETIAAATAEQKVPVPALPPAEFNPDTRKTELLGFTESKVIYTAKRLGIKTKGKTITALVDEILAKETLNAM